MDYHDDLALFSTRTAHFLIEDQGKPDFWIQEYRYSRLGSEFGKLL